MKIGHPWAAVGVIVAVVFLGGWLALHKPLWNDEIFTQTSTVERSSWMDILRVRFEEGNSAPLYYLLQKAVCTFMAYHFPEEWNGEWTVADGRSQIVLRIVSILSIAFMAGVVFVFFLSRFGWVSAVYALASVGSSFMVLAYVAEARPYALWMLVSTLQLIVFLQWVRGTVSMKKETWMNRLAAVHFCAALTMVASLIPIVGVSLGVWLWGERRWKKHLFLTALPVGVCLVYYVLSPTYQFWFKETPFQLIRASFPLDRLAVGALYVLGWAVPAGRSLCSKERSRAVGTPEDRAVMWEFFLWLAGAGVLAGFLAVKASPPGQGFQISNRYFSFLVPMSVVVMTMAFQRCWAFARGRPWIQGGVILFFGGLWAWRMMRSWALASELYSF